MLLAMAPVLAEGFVFKLDQAELSLFKGKAQAHATATLAPVTGTKPQDMAQLLNQLTASVRVQVSEQLLGGLVSHINQHNNQPSTSAEANALVSMMLQGLLDQGYLIKTATGYQLNFFFNQGQSRLNGKVVGAAKDISLAEREDMDGALAAYR